MPAEGWEVPFGCVPEACKENYFIMALHLCAVQFCVTVAKERIGTHTFVDECLKRRGGAYRNLVGTYRNA